MPRGDARTWEGDRYAEASGHHRAFDDWFLEQHPPRAHDRIVDAGCGSGEFTARLAALAPHGQVIGVDPDPSMLEAARRHEAANLEFRRATLQNLDRVCDPSWADLVVSRAVFHWIRLEDYRRCYEAIRRVLRPGGWFHAESGAAGNVRRLARVLDDVADRLGIEPTVVTFPDPDVVLELLEQAGFDVPRSGVTTVTQRRAFDRDQLLGLVRTQASMACDLGQVSDQRFLDEVTARLDELRRHDGSFDQTFVRLHVRCRRPE